MSNQHMSALLWRAVELHITLLLLLSLLSFLLHNLLGVVVGGFLAPIYSRMLPEKKKTNKPSPTGFPSCSFPTKSN